MRLFTRLASKDYIKTEKGFDEYCKSLQRHRDNGSLNGIVNDLERDGLKSDSAQLEFFSYIIDEFQEIWSNLSAKYTHHMLKQRHPQWRANFHVDTLELELMCFYTEIGALCAKVAEYKSKPKVSEPLNWDGYRDWEIQKR